jgi:NAD(P)-dependent dehydrogenase (short-subunit alcohol dehydrogenase family)
MKDNMTAVVTGASRGLGRAAAEALARKGYSVIMAMRNSEKKLHEIETLKKAGLKISAAELDVSDSVSISEFISYINSTYARCDVLINNAGIFNDDRKNSGSPLYADIDVIKESMEVNTFGPLRLIQGIIPLMKKNGYGRIVNVSSGMGSFDEMDRGYISYRMSKTALNVITRLTSPELEGTDILINSVCPGWVKTDMGGPGAERTIEEGIGGIIWAATLPQGGPSGGFFRDGKRINW